MAKAQTFDISKFYTKDRFERGVPFEPVVDGEPVGISFDVIGYNSVKAATAVEKFAKFMEEMKKEKDPKRKKEMEYEANAELASSLVVGFSEGSRGPVTVEDKPLEYSESVCYAIMLNSLPIANEIINFSTRNKNFIQRSV